MLEKIKQLASERNISIRAIEIQLGFGNGTIGKWSESMPSVEKVAKVAEYFGVPLEDLIKERDE